MMKLPQHVVKSIWFRLNIDPKEIKTSGSFLQAAKCPLCKDYKHRMYLKEYSDFYSVKCHNCGYNTKFESFLKDEFPFEHDFLKDYFIDSIRTGEIFKPVRRTERKIITQPEIELTDVRLRMYLKQNGFRVQTQQNEHKKEILRNRVLDYIKTRKIPKDIYSDFWVMTSGLLKGYIGIPFFDSNKENMIHVQGRLFADLGRENPQKYLFLKDLKSELQIELPGKEIWGQWRTKPNETTMVCEGTLDAPAFRNGVATCGATIGMSFINDVKKRFPNCIWSVDNYWTDDEGHKLTEKLLNMGEKCFIIPKEIEAKDANSLIQFMDWEYVPDDFIKENTFSGKIGLAKLKLLT